MERQFKNYMFHFKEKHKFFHLKTLIFKKNNVSFTRAPSCCENHLKIYLKG